MQRESDQITPKYYTSLHGKAVYKLSDDGAMLTVLQTGEEHQLHDGLLENMTDDIFVAMLKMLYHVTETHPHVFTDVHGNIAASNIPLHEFRQKERDAKLSPNVERRVEFVTNNRLKHIQPIVLFNGPGVFEGKHYIIAPESIRQLFLTLHLHVHRPDVSVYEFLFDHFRTINSYKL